MPFAWAAGAAAIGSIASAAIGGSASESAANTEANAANQAAQVQQNMFNTTQKNLSPYMGAGQNGLQALLAQLGIGSNGSFNPNAPLAAGAGTFTPYMADRNTAGPLPTFTAGPAAPKYNALTAATFQQSPGYNYELQQQQSAIQNSAAARGGLSGNTLSALQANAQGLASQDWANANNQNIANYDASLGGWQANQNANLQNFGAATSAYDTAFNSGQSVWSANQNANVQNFGTSYDATRGNQNYLLSALQSLAGSGQNAAANLGGFGQTAAGNIGNDLISAGNATAAGQIGSANSFSGGVNNLSSLLASYMNGGNIQSVGYSAGYDPTTTNYSQLSPTVPTMSYDPDSYS